jgi:hypothetical protein
VTRFVYAPLPCLGCGVMVEIAKTDAARGLARRGRAYCGEDCKAKVVREIRAASIARTNRLHASTRMKANNPMHRGDARERMTATLRAIGHKPSVRGGNGTGLTAPQAALLDALGYPWEAELIVPTLQKRGSGYPTHYKLDLAHPLLEIAVELDGQSHCLLSRQAQDRKKDQFLRDRAWAVLRLKNEDVMRDVPAAAEAIRRFERHWIDSVINAPWPADIAPTAPVDLAW